MRYVAAVSVIIVLWLLLMAVSIVWWGTFGGMLATFFRLVDTHRAPWGVEVAVHLTKSLWDN